MAQSPAIIALVGPTATGKTELGLNLAQHFAGEIINVDALQFYPGMNIGTAKLPAAQRRGIPHHFIDHLNLAQPASVAEFQQHGRAKIAELRANNIRPIAVGGSGLYVRALLDHMEFPGTDPELRKKLEAEYARSGIKPLRDRLKQVDSASESRIQDDRRIIRALEVYEHTGKPFSSFMPQREYVCPAVQIGLDVDRAELYRRIDQRIDTMLENGLLEEVQSLMDHGLASAPTARLAIGYQQLLSHLAGEITLHEAVQQIKTATRHFAKRQQTWFKADPRVHWFAATDPALSAKVTAFIEHSPDADTPGKVS